MTHDSTRPVRAGAIVVAFAALLFLPGLGRRHIFTANEGQRADPPIEMMATGDWIVPRLNGVEYLKKPPLLYWQVAASYRLFGVSEWSARLPCALMAIAFVAAVFGWARRIDAAAPGAESKLAEGQEIPRARARLAAAQLAALFAAANYLILSKARECELDIGVALFTLLAMWAWWSALERLDGGRPGFGRAVAWGALWLAVANLYKIPVPFLFLATGWAGAIVAMRRWRWFLRWQWWAGFVASVVPVALWAWAAAGRVGWQRAMDIWWREATLHAAEATEINSGPVWFYLIRLPACLAPWIAFVALYARPRPGRAAIVRPERRLAFHLLWTCAALSLVVLSLNTAKETEYMIGLFGTVCILLGWAAEEWIGFDHAGRPVRRGRWTAVVVGLGLWLVASWAGLHYHETYRNGTRSMSALGQEARHAIERGVPVAIADLSQKPQLYFYVRHVLPNFPKRDDGIRFLAENPNGLLIVNAKKWKTFQAEAAEAGLPSLKVVRASGPESKILLIERADSHPPPKVP